MNMKRTVFGLLLLSALLALACQQTQQQYPSPSPSPSSAAAAASPQPSQQARLLPTIKTAKPDVKSVLILIYKDKTGDNKIMVIPETIRLDMAKNQKINFAAFDNLEDDIESVELDFGANEPLDGGKKFTIGEVLTGNENETETGKAKQKGTFKYSITVNVKGGKPITLDPQVEIGG